MAALVVACTPLGTIDPVTAMRADLTEVGGATLLEHRTRQHAAFEKTLPPGFKVLGMRDFTMGSEQTEVYVWTVLGPKFAQEASDVPAQCHGDRMRLTGHLRVFVVDGRCRFAMLRAADGALDEPPHVLFTLYDLVSVPLPQQQ